MYINVRIRVSPPPTCSQAIVGRSRQALSGTVNDPGSDDLVRDGFGGPASDKITRPGAALSPSSG
jgi:hypothetical protein